MPLIPTAEELIALLNLQPHPKEGGFFRETYRSEEQVPASAFASRYGGPRSVGTCIYYLLTPGTFSALHRLASDEIFHHYLGDPVEMLQLLPDSSGRTVVIGPDVRNGQSPQVIVPRGAWQGSRLMSGGRVAQLAQVAQFALLGTTVAPGFDYADYEHGRREQLLADYPVFAELIRALTTA